jgi:hypothetical protein
VIDSIECCFTVSQEKRALLLRAWFGDFACGRDDSVLPGSSWFSILQLIIVRRKMVIACNQNGD